MLLRFFLSLVIISCLAPVTEAKSPQLSLDQGDHVCLVGNALCEGLQHQNHWEAALYQRFPEHDLVVRNLGFPGDEPLERIRSENFGDPDQHLTHSSASVILFFFGYNESFAGQEGLAKFKEELTQLVKETQEKDYGKGSPKIALISPIAFEQTNDPNLPKGDVHNQRLSMYTNAMREVADACGVVFADVYTPTLELFNQEKERYTLNGCHLNSKGYKAFAPILMTALFGGQPADGISEALVDEIDDKNFHWWHRYRAVNGYSIYGSRGKAGNDGTYNNTDVMERERAILDEMTSNRDQRIWMLAQGKTVDTSVDDSNTLPFIEPKTNVGGPDDPNAKRGKLGSLDYLTASEQAKLFKIHPDFEIQLVASEEQFPELANPVALNFDNQGRLWVATMQSYPQWKPKTQLNDKILIFEDKDGDGSADECKVFIDGLHQPTGFEIGNGGVYIAEQPDIIFAQDTDGDDIADTRTRQLFGFDSADSHHGIAAFEWGPGGNLYFQEGTFKFSQVESPYGLTRMSEAGIWRHHPKTHQLTAFCNFAFANPWGHVFDRWGQNFIGDASPGNSYWAAPLTGRIDYPLKHPGGSQHRRIAGTTGGDPAYKFPTFYTKRTRPLGGCAMVSSRHFPPEMQGNFLVTNCIGDRGILNHTVAEEGSGFKGTEVEPLLMCDDGNFRPVDIQIAPDGTLYIIDWHNALIGHLQHNLREPNRDTSHGRIWRLKHKTRPVLEPAKIAGQPVGSLLELLKVPEDRTRYRARRELAQRQTQSVMPEVKKWIAGLSVDDDEYEHHLLEALWIHQTHHQINLELLQQLLGASDHRARAAATRVLSFWLDEVPNHAELLAQCIEDEHPRVRLEGVRAVSFLRGDEAIELALGVLENDLDEYLQYTLDETMRRLEQ